MATKKDTTPQAEETNEARQARLEAIARELYATALKWALAHQYAEAPWARINPRFGLKYAIWFETHNAYKNDEGLWWTQHTCELTGRRFALPLGAPVPVLFYDNLNEKGKPSQGCEESYSIVHPELAAAGTAAIRDHLCGAVEGLREEAADKLIMAEELERMGELIPEKLEVEWPDYWLQDQPTGEKQTERKLYRVIDQGYER